MLESKVEDKMYSNRRLFVFVLLLGGMMSLVGRAIDLQVLNRPFLQQAALKQHISEISVAAYRGKITDRHGRVLAMSAPVPSIWMDPVLFEADPTKTEAVGKVLGLSAANLKRIDEANSHRRFVYLRRRAHPKVANRIDALTINGIYSGIEYHRFYPSAEVTAQLIGFTDIDDNGQEGLELAFDQWLSGQSGSKKIRRDGRQRAIEDLGDVKSVSPGRDLALTINQDLQYLAYRELKSAIIKHRAKSGSIVVLEPQSGEVLAMVNQPSFNPNSSKNRFGRLYRNRAVTDVFEPGSTVKPFTLACALEAKTYHEHAQIDTSPGTMRVGRNYVKDFRDYGVLSFSGILAKSSNVGVSKVGLSLSPSQLWKCFHDVGFGQYTGVQFPGEVPGALRDHFNLRRFEQATLSFGYGLSTTALQLARAYAVLANDGVLPVASLLNDQINEVPVRAMSAATAARIRSMLEEVVSPDGTGSRAQVPGFTVAGKTGTVKKLGKAGYVDDKHISIFAGMAPASKPEFVAVVVIHEPEKGGYYGGVVAAPVFASIAENALRILGTQPDKEDSVPMLLAEKGIIE